MGIETIVSTLTAEGTEHMNCLILETARALVKTGHYLVGTYIGKEDTPLAKDLNRIYDDFIIREPPVGSFFKRAKVLCNTIAQGYKENMRISASRNPKAILSTEGDKPEFVEYIDLVTAPLLKDKADVTLAARSREGWNDFPLIQKCLEGLANIPVRRAVGIRADFMYGPRAFTPETAALFEHYPKNDWGVLTYPVVAAAKRNYRIMPVEVPGFPQHGYMEKYTPMMKILPVQALWRLMQNIPHITATRQAIRDSSR